MHSALYLYTSASLIRDVHVSLLCMSGTVYTESEEARAPD